MVDASILSCSRCGYRFNYLRTPGASLNAARRLDAVSFRCPRCHIRQRFDLGSHGAEASLPTYDDRVRAVDLLVAMAPFLIGVPAGVMVLALGGPLGLGLGAIGAGIAGVAVYGGLRIARGEVPPARKPEVGTV